MYCDASLESDALMSLTQLRERGWVAGWKPNDYIDRLDRINLPTQKTFIRDTANLILQARALRAEQANPPTVGKKWVDRFIKRYKYNIIPSYILDANWYASENPEAINARFVKFKAVVSEHGIVADDIWNIDEMGFQIGVGKNQMVVTKRRRAHYFSLPTNRESAIVVEAISACWSSYPCFFDFIQYDTG
jgi:hypothetical protein